ncbi:sigma-70 family RNA polymerase sigma factor [Polyangium sp. 6x1]|uniref:sigma-70 family RNA polymerase sigma factor n=1 Tax=Polyangium sp. 6x1 TaxID=3042689 RepID=UPI002482D549|nr:sigma-70 family RNA polymerase sigma factor [Polyangium sp. 6x1]MDI1450736.1 sigma-70 family RNA polymerase sigma factor [Polyangium sp. 6x1]
MNKLRIAGPAKEPARKRHPRTRKGPTPPAPRAVAPIQDATDLYLRGLEASQPLTREAEAELGRRIVDAERDALSALVRSPAIVHALAAIAEEIRSGQTNPRDLLLNGEAPDAADVASRLVEALERTRALAEGPGDDALPADLADAFDVLRVDPTLVERLDQALAARAKATSDEEQARIEEARDRSAKARARAAHEKSELVRANLRLVVATARHYGNRGVPLLDLVQEGNLGLIRAADKFDYSRGYRFGTYAAWWIRQSIERALLYQGKDVRMPVHLTASRRRVLGAERALSQKNARVPSQEEIAESSGVPLDKVQAVRALSLSPVSLDAPMGEEGDFRFGDTLASETDAPDEALVRSRMREAASAMLETLTPREREVLKLRYGLTGEDDHTLEQIGRSFSLSRERIRQIESKALEKLRTWSEERGLGSYLEGLR